MSTLASDDSAVPRPDRHPLRYRLTLVVLAFLLYLPGLAYDFIYDDNYLVLARFEKLQQSSTLFHSFTQPFTKGLAATRDMPYYRPLADVSYVIDAHLWGKLSAGYHLTNVLLFIVAILGLFELLRRLEISPGLSFLGAALFLAHTTNISSVAWIAGRTDLLAGAFGVWALVAFETVIARTKTGQPRILPLILTGLLLLGGLLSKETAILFPLLMFFMLWRHYPDWRRWDTIPGLRLGVLAPVLAVILYLIARTLVVSSIVTPVPNPWRPLGETLGRTFLNLGAAWTFSLFPVDLPSVRPFREAFLSVAPWLGYATALFLGLWVLLRRNRLAMWAFVGWLLTPLIFNLPFSVHTGNQTHLLYLPSLFAAALVILLVATVRWTPIQWAASGLVGLVILASIILVHYRLPAFTDETSFWTYQIEREPTQPISQGNYAKILADQGKVEQAIPLFHASLDQWFNYAALINLGVAQNHRREHAAAESTLTAAVEWAPNNVQVRYWRGYVSCGQLGLAGAVRDWDKVWDLGGRGSQFEMLREAAHRAAAKRLTALRDSLKDASPTDSIAIARKLIPLGAEGTAETLLVSRMRLFSEDTAALRGLVELDIQRDGPLAVANRALYLARLTGRAEDWCLSGEWWLKSMQENQAEECLSTARGIRESSPAVAILAARLAIVREDQLAGMTALADLKRVAPNVPERYVLLQQARDLGWIGY